jgi:hypothetical protein
MTYPLSSAVSAGQPTAADHYNNLRSDALYFGQVNTNAVDLGTALQKYASGMKLEYKSVNRVRVPYDVNNPPTIMIAGYLLQTAANVDLPNGLITGSAAVYYIFAVRYGGFTTFGLTASTSATEAVNTRIIGQAYWDGTNLTLIQSYTFVASGLPAADYDSGWFAVAYNQTYTKTHLLGVQPKHAVLVHSTDSGGTSEWVRVNVVATVNLNDVAVIGYDLTSIIVTTGSSSSYDATCHSTRRSSAAGYYRILAWK